MILDLEDAVAPERKVRAREVVARLIGSGTVGPEVIVRVNGAGTEWFADDLAALRGTAVAIMLPKATLDTVVRVPAGFDVIGLVETAAGVEQAAAVAGASGVVRLMLGSADLAAELGIALSDGEFELHYPRARVAMGSAAGEIEPPIDVVHLDVADLDGLRIAARRAQRLGLAAKACIHPRQVAVVNDTFTPSDQEIAGAVVIVEACEAATRDRRGVVALDGRVIDRPVVLRAQRTLRSAAIRPRQTQATGRTSAADTTEL